MKVIIDLQLSYRLAILISYSDLQMVLPRDPVSSWMLFWAREHVTWTHMFIIFVFKFVKK